MRQHWYCYLARTGDGSLLTGVADDTAAAVRQLNDGAQPVFLAYAEEYMNEKDAARRSDAIRRMSDDRKERLLAAANVRAAEEFTLGFRGLV
jgi:predicted GIY-YIG superfamily endonuclease